MKKASNSQLNAKIEALLFVHGEPLSLDRLAHAIGTKRETIKDALGELAEEYNARGFAVLEKDGMYQLSTHPSHAALVESLVKYDTQEELSRAAIETLSIIAYKGPLTRVEIEYIRGVHSSFIVRNLLLRGLIERSENPKDARSPLYRISFDCLKYLGVKKIEDLPHYAEFKAGSLPIYEKAALSLDA